MRRIDNISYIYSGSSSKGITKMKSSMRTETFVKTQAKNNYRQNNTKKAYQKLNDIYSSEEEEDEELDFSEAIKILKLNFHKYDIHELTPLDTTKQNHLARNLQYYFR